MKQAKQLLLHYKQKYPHVFQDVCLYSDVCKIISESVYRLHPRRFIQELFIEVKFNIYYELNAEILKRNRVPLQRIEEDKPTVVRLSSFSNIGMEQRKQELLHTGPIFQTNKNVIRGFKIEPTNLVEEKCEDRLSPTKFEPRSPPLTSVKEENITSTENLHMKNKDDSNCKTDTTKTSLTAMKTLDSLHLTCNENKFPIKNRNDTKIIK